LDRHKILSYLGTASAASRILKYNVLTQKHDSLSDQEDQLNLLLYFIFPPGRSYRMADYSKWKLRSAQFIPPGGHPGPCHRITSLVLFPGG
jgi:hypothetical protein